MTSLVPDTRIKAVRRFNRLYTRIIGALDAGLVRTPYSLAEARMLYELLQRGTTEVTELRRELDLDAGYLSRLLSQLASDGLVMKGKSVGDARRQTVWLTEEGIEAAGTLDQRATDQIRALLDPMAESDQRDLIDAMRVISDRIGGQPDTGALLLRPPGPGDFGWVIERHGALYAQEYGWDSTFEAMVARIVADYIENRDPVRDAGWIAEVDGRQAGCVFCVQAGEGPANETRAKLRMLLVEPTARGLGVGSRLVDQCVQFATSAGYRRLTLWTNDVLVAARRIYERAGFRLVDEQPHRSFGHDLVGQTLRLDLPVTPAET